MQVTIIGSGLIGRAWAMIFASQGHQIKIFDINDEILKNSLKIVQAEMSALAEKNNLRNLENFSLEQQISLISVTSDMSLALSQAEYVQECVPENLDLKRKVWSDIAENLDQSLQIKFLASSTSCILPKLLFKNLPQKFKKISFVAHPINPPYFVPLVELSPDEHCQESTLQAAKQLLTNLGQKPVILRKQVDGFALNRLQYPVINAAWQMYKNGVMSVEDLDTVMVHGLGMRYACIGTFETCHLNANGIGEYFEKYHENVKRVSDEIVGPAGGLSYDFKGEGEKDVLEGIRQEMEAIIPLDKLDEARKSRDEKLVKLSKI